jgi:hypothetical protein
MIELTQEQPFAHPPHLPTSAPMPGGKIILATPNDRASANILLSEPVTIAIKQS